MQLLMSAGRTCRDSSGNCACGSLLLALLLMPVITANPLLGLLIVFFLLSSSKK